MKMIYAVQMDVPLGTRNGKMYFHITDDGIVGMVEILGGVYDFSGTLLEQGKFEITGQFNSGNRKIAYIGHGVMKDEKIQIELSDGKRVYKVTGQAFAKIQE